MTFKMIFKKEKRKAFQKIKKIRKSKIFNSKVDKIFNLINLKVFKIQKILSRSSRTNYIIVSSLNNYKQLKIQFKIKKIMKM